VGVFAGASSNEYAAALDAGPEVRAAVDPFQIGLATSRDFLSTRVYYKLGLEGPSLTVQTGCSTSLASRKAGPSLTPGAGGGVARAQCG
jgi:acyl transferase domain-containing protein